jgi:hypothetical protein
VKDGISEMSEETERGSGERFALSVRAYVCVAGRLNVASLNFISNEFIYFVLFYFVWI